MNATRVERTRGVRKPPTGDTLRGSREDHCELNRGKALESMSPRGRTAVEGLVTHGNVDPLATVGWVSRCLYVACSIYPSSIIPSKIHNLKTGEIQRVATQVSEIVSIMGKMSLSPEGVTTTLRNSADRRKVILLELLGDPASCVKRNFRKDI